jgi:hypothetical protein
MLMFFQQKKISGKVLAFATRFGRTGSPSSGKIQFPGKSVQIGKVSFSFAMHTGLYSRNRK